MDKFYYADSLGEKYKFLDKKYRPMISSKLQKIENLCGFYTIYAAYELFKFNITHINYFNDVLVRNFISNYIVKSQIFQDGNKETVATNKYFKFHSTRFP